MGLKEGSAIARALGYDGVTRISLSFETDKIAKVTVTRFLTKDELQAIKEILPTVERDDKDDYRVTPQGGG